MKSSLIERLDRIEAAVNTALPSIEERPLTQGEAIKFLGRSRQSIVNMRKRGIIQAYRLNGRLYFWKSELVKAMEQL